jgi:two-component system, NtrC family, sensor histidine kinase HydH
MSDAAQPPSLEQYTELAEMAGGFIHDIKNHIGTLSLNLQLLAEDFENPESQRERRALERITRLSDECARLAELANDFLRFARVHELHCEPTPLATVVERMIDFLAPTARHRGIRIEWFPAPDLPQVNLDRELFEQALLNLMLNAEQAMPEGGTITLIGRSEGNEVCLDVIDTGCGMTPDMLGKVFQPFHTTKKTGSGLGLPTARKVVLAHGGIIEVQSELDRGTKMTVRLPISR